MNLFAIPAGAPFLETLAAGWLADRTRAGAPVEAGLILLPTRRAARALAEAFLRASSGQPLLLPRITALGAIDEAPLALAGALDLPPAINEAERLALLARLVLAMGGRHGAPRALDRAWMLAAELARLMDEAERAEVDLRAALPRAVDAAHAEHWQRTLDFLGIVTEHWPAMLAERGLANPAARQAALLRAQARAWTGQPPLEPVWAAGITRATPAAAALLRAIARAAQGRVILPAFEGMTDADGPPLPATHPHAGLTRLLAGIGARVGDVAAWPHDATVTVPVGRSAVLHAALSAAGPAAWPRVAPATPHLARLRATDEQEEAAAIAMILREAIERPAATAALVTPDRTLAARVVAELGRWGVVADDSGGEPLSETPQGAFLRLLARALAEDLAPVPLLALLKSPLTAIGLPPAQCRALVRGLERACLRGPRPGPGIAGLRHALEAASPGANPRERERRFLESVEAALRPALRLRAAMAQSPLARLDALLESAEALATTDTEPGAARLWSGEEGQALATLLGEVRDALRLLDAHDMRAVELVGLLDAVMEGAVVRSRRALRGRDGAFEHPRVFIWGVVEARLQSADVVVLGGLAEGVWPQATDPGPWLSRPMRAAVGLPSPEEAVGQAAHDFLGCALAAPEIVLSCPTRRDRAPAVPSRFLARLETMLRAGGASGLAEHRAASWAARLDEPLAVEPESPPAPRPPVAVRPRALSVTEIETWRRDPYAIYAKHILRLRPLDPLDAESDAAMFGEIVHNGLHATLARFGTLWPADAAHAVLVDELEAALAVRAPHPARAAWWRARLARIAAWVDVEERRRRRVDPIETMLAEVKGELRIDAADFVLRGRADRIERRAGGRLAIIDYKTGDPPKPKAVESGYYPQLPLEAAMAEQGAFGPAGVVDELVFWHLPGGATDGNVCHACKDLEKAKADAFNGLCDLIARYDDPARPYLSRPLPEWAPKYSDYRLLARAHEWSAARDDAE